MKRVIADTGPLVAYFDRDSAHHGWVREQFAQLSSPLYSCQPVLTETLFLLKRGGIRTDLPLAMIERGDLICDFDLGAEIQAIRRLMRNYRDLPATLADVCLVHMSETSGDCVIFTLDTDFQIYRRHRRRVIPLLAPFP